MLVSLNVGAYFRGGMHAQQCDRPFLRPTPTNARESEPWRWGSGSKLITIRATVYGDLAWGRGKPRPEHRSQATQHHAALRRRAPQSIASRCAPHSYSHVLPNMQDSAVAAMEEAFS